MFRTLKHSGHTLPSKATRVNHSLNPLQKVRGARSGLCGAVRDMVNHESLVKDAIIYATQHGLVYGLGPPHPEVGVVHAPLSVLPVIFPRGRFVQAKKVMPLFNELIDRVSQDEPFLEETLAAAAREDEFTARLLQVLRDTRPARQALQGLPLVLGIHRSDYMLDAPSGRFLQVEINTIAASFACLSSLTSNMHRYLLGRIIEMGEAPSIGPLNLEALPPNTAMEGLVDALAAGVQHYPVAGGVMVMVVQPGERNAYDQQWLQTRLWERHRVQTVRMTLEEMADQCQVDQEGHLRSKGGQLVAVAYFRAGYGPGDYPSDRQWQARHLLECSRAVKCPSVAYQLVGAKKVQQTLAVPGVLERFMKKEEEVAALRDMFAGLWSLDDPSDATTREIMQQALDEPHKFVLKPQREGGGNNLYGQELQAALRAGSGLSAYILMQRILPPPQRSLLVRQGVWSDEETVSELGIYGTYLRRGQQVLLNSEVGHLVRTKTSSSNEGGVAAGFAVLDSPYLVEGATYQGGSHTLLDMIGEEK